MAAFWYFEVYDLIALNVNYGSNWDRQVKKKSIDFRVRLHGAIYSRSVLIIWVTEKLE